MKKLTYNEVGEIMVLLSHGVPRTFIAERYGSSIKTIGHIATGYTHANHEMRHVLEECALFASFADYFKM